MKNKNPDDYTDEELRNLDHNNHEAAFKGYLRKSRHSFDKHEFLFNWINPQQDDYILECGSSSGKTSVDLASRSGCRCLGVDFDEEAVKVSTAMRDAHFPNLSGRCEFMMGDLTSMKFDRAITKVLMPDFTEHIPDRVITAILENIRLQLPNALLHIYTPARSHIFEIMKHRNFILKNTSGHINVKTRLELEHLLENNGWKIVSSDWHSSSMWYMKIVELMFGYLPWIGKYFQRRIAIKAVVVSGELDK